MRPFYAFDDHIKLQLLSREGITLAAVQIPQSPPVRAPLYGADAASGGLWVLTQDANTPRLRLFRPDGSMASDRLLGAAPNAGLYEGFVGQAGEYLSSGTGVLSRHAADGTLLHSTVASLWVVLDDTVEGALLVHSPSLVRRLDRNGNTAWQTVPPAFPSGNACIRWSHGFGTRRLRVVQTCNLTPADIQVERWNLATGAVEHQQLTPWDASRFGTPSVALGTPQFGGQFKGGRLQVDAAGELLYAVSGHGGELLRFTAGAPAALLDVPDDGDTVDFAWANSAGDLVVLAPRIGLTGAIGVTSWHSGLLQDSFK